MNEELLVAALTMKEVMFCFNMTKELGFRICFEVVHMYIDNTSALQISGAKTYSSRVKPASRFFFIYKLVNEGRLCVHDDVTIEDQLPDIPSISARTGTDTSSN